MDKTTSRQPDEGNTTAPLSIRQLRARKKRMKAELDGLSRQAAAMEHTASASVTLADALSGIVDRETELCRELAQVISLIRSHTARSRRAREFAGTPAQFEAAVGTAIHIDPFFDQPIDITGCVTNCDSDCVTNCTDGCTLACESDCRTGCTSGCTFSQSGSNTGSYIVTPMITADGLTAPQPVTSNQFSIEWN